MEGGWRSSFESVRVAEQRGESRLRGSRRSGSRWTWRGRGVRATVGNRTWVRELYERPRPTHRPTRPQAGGSMKSRSLGAAVMATLAVLSLSAAGCTGSSGGTGNGGVKEGGVLRIGTGEGISSLNPFVGFNQDDFNVWMYIYPSLLQYDTTTPTFDYAPGFAQSWEQSADGLTWTFHTTPNATWSDGEALTADDAAWTLNTIMKYKNGPTAAWAGSVASVASV